MADPRYVPRWLRQLFSRPVQELNRWERALRFAADLAVHCVQELRHDRATHMAAALTFHTLFSLLPMIVLAMVLVHGFVGEAERAQFERTIVNFLLPETETAGAPPEAETRQELNQAREVFAERISQLMDSLREINLGGIGLVGVLVFVYGATALLSTIEDNFNSILGVSRGRPWYVRLPLYYTVITLAPVLLIVAQVLQLRILDALRAAEWVNWLIGPVVAVAMPLVATWVLLFLMYVLLPATSVPLRAAGVGSFVAALVGVLTHAGFQIYVVRTAIHTFYGALALLPLFLFWLWLVWLVILFGLELTHTVSAMRGRHFKHQMAHPAEEPMIDPVWVVPVAARIAECFAEGRACRVEDLAQSLDLSPRAVRRMLKTLEGAGIVHRVQQAGGDQYFLSRPAERITVRDLLDSVRSHLTTPDQARHHPDDAAWRMVERLYEARREMTEHTTLADLHDNGEGGRA